MAPQVNFLKLIQQIFTPNTDKPATTETRTKQPLLSFENQPGNTTLGYTEGATSVTVPQGLVSQYSGVDVEYPKSEYAPLDLTGEEIAQNPTYIHDIANLEQTVNPPRDFELAEV